MARRRPSDRPPEIEGQHLEPDPLPPELAQGAGAIGRVRDQYTDPVVSAPKADLANRRLLERVGGIPRVRKKWLAELYAAWGDAARAARAARVPYGTATEWIRDAESDSPKDTWFAELWKTAVTYVAGQVEEEIRRRGMDGVIEHVTSGGDLVWTAYRIEHAPACTRKQGGSCVDPGTITGDLPACRAAEPVPCVRDRDGAIIVTTHDGVILEVGDYAVRPLTVRRYSDKLLLARARAVLPDRYGADAPDRGETPDRTNFADLVRRVGVGGTGAAARSAGVGVDKHARNSIKP